MTLRQQIITDSDGDPTRAAVRFARALMQSDPGTFKVGYSQVNAVLAATELFPEVASDAVRDGIDAQFEDRAARRARLVEHFGVEPWALECGDADEPARRYAAVAGIGEYEDARLSTFDRLRDALDDLADGILDGLAPDAVYDLDTGQKLEIHVSTPIVTVSDKQHARRNPLDHEPEG